MSSIPLEILVILILITVNGLLAMAEIAIVSARKTRLQRRAEDGDAKAQAALELAKNPSDFLSTVQIGITLVGVLAGAFGGATIAAKLAEWLKDHYVFEPCIRRVGSQALCINKTRGYSWAFCRSYASSLEVKQPSGEVLKRLYKPGIANHEG
jgi:putative hemolysin